MSVDGAVCGGRARFGHVCSPQNRPRSRAGNAWRRNNASLRNIATRAPPSSGVVHHTTYEVVVPTHPNRMCRRDSRASFVCRAVSWTLSKSDYASLQSDLACGIVSIRATRAALIRSNHFTRVASVRAGIQFPRVSTCASRFCESFAGGGSRSREGGVCTRPTSRRLGRPDAHGRHRESAARPDELAQHGNRVVVWFCRTHDDEGGWRQSDRSVSG